MNVRAYALREPLELDELERTLTRGAILAHVVTVAIAILSIAVLAATGNPGWSGVTYFLMGPAHTAVGILNARNAEKARARLGG